jgi:hypothetical protein
MKIRRILAKLVEPWKPVHNFRRSVHDVARTNGLAIEYLEGVPAKVVDGWLDTTSETPRFILVNRNLAPCEQTYVIARNLAIIAHHSRQRSHLLDRPWKWHRLDNAPNEIKETVSKLDIFWRTYSLMFNFASREHFLDFYLKRHPKLFLLAGFSDNIANIHFTKLRIRNFYTQLFHVFAW